MQEKYNPFPPEGKSPMPTVSSSVPERNTSRSLSPSSLSLHQRDRNPQPAVRIP